MDILTIATWVLLGFLVLGLATTVYLIGKPREPITNNGAIIMLTVGFLQILIIVELAKRAGVIQ